MQKKQQRYSQNSRYYNCDTSDNGVPQHNMLKSTYTYYTTTVQSNEAGRLDLVSLRVYNTPINWWLIARFNAIISPELVVAGTVLKVPYL